MRVSQVRRRVDCVEEVPCNLVPHRYLADALQSAKNGGVFLDEQPIGKLRSDWQPGPGYEAVRSLTYAP